MAKQCLRCKREIAKKQKECFVCGSTQNIISYYFGGGMLVVLLIVIASAVSYWFISQANVELHENLEQLDKANAQLMAAEETANQAIEQVKQARQDAELAQQQANQETQVNNQTNAEIAEAKEKALEAQKNVNWLSKQNKDFKAEVQRLTEQLEAAQQAQSTSQLSESQIADRINTASQADKAQIQTLQTEIASLKQQLLALQTPNQ